MATFIHVERQTPFHDCKCTGVGDHVAQSLVHGLLLPEDVHTFKDGTDESLGRRLQWHTIVVTPWSLILH